MPSPDVSGTVDLTVYDITPADLVDRALAYAETQLPEAQFPTGSVEVVMLEALAIPVGELVYAINRLPGAVLEVLLARLYNIARSPGVLPTGAVEFSADPSGASIPMNTLVGVVVGDDTVQFVTDAELTIPAATPSATVTVTGLEYTALANGTAAGTPVVVLSATSGVTTAVVSTILGGGQDPEESEDYLDRASLVLQRLSSTLVTPDHFTAFALAWPGVYRAFTVDNYNSDTPAVAAGHVSVAVLDSSGANLSPGAKAALLAGMDTAALASLGVHVFNPTITAVNVTAEVHSLPGYDTTAVQAACVAALDAFLSPLTWGWGAKVRRNDLITLLENVEGVDYVKAGDPSVPSGDVTLSGQAPLADLGTATISVVGP